MKEPKLTIGRTDARLGPVYRAALLAALTLTGCVNVSAPEKPIEINLNVTVRQEVVVRLQKDAEDFITDNPELFPK